MHLMKLTYQLHSFKMYLRLFSLVVLTSFLPSPAFASSDTPFIFKVSPERCVALRQGQTCYQLVTFSWQYVQEGNYCLVALSTSKVLQCWQQTNVGLFELDFQSSENQEFALRRQGQDENIATALVTVAWVFKSSKRPKSNWKLF
jgi:hypothetical protein